MHLHPSTIDRLVVDTQAGDTGAFKKLYDLYAPSINRLILDNGISGIRSYEIMNQVFRSAWKDLPAFNAHDQRFFTWLINIARIHVTVEKGSCDFNSFLAGVKSVEKVQSTVGA